MKLKMEPERFKKLLEAGMIMKGRPLVNPLIIKFSPKEANISDLYLELIGVHIELKKAFFSEYSGEGEEVVSFPLAVLERLGWGFKDDMITVSSDGEKISINGKNDSYSIEMDDIEPKPFPFHFKSTEHGIMLDNVELKSAIKVDAKELKLPPGREYLFELKDGKLTAKISDLGSFTRVINGNVIGGEDVSVTLDSSYYNAITSNLEGEILFVLNENFCVFSENGENHSKIYFLAVIG